MDYATLEQNFIKNLTNRVICTCQAREIDIDLKVDQTPPTVALDLIQSLISNACILKETSITTPEIVLNKSDAELIVEILESKGYTVRYEQNTKKITNMNNIWFVKLVIEW